jgi:putative membrane protein
MTRNWMIFAAAAALSLTLACAKNESTDASTDSNTTATDTSNTMASAGSTDTTASSSTVTPANSGAMNATASSLAPEDKDFVMKAAMGGMAEVMGGQTAATKATGADVKAFGERMVADHGKANDELKTFAAQKGLALPMDLDAEHKAAMDKLNAKSGKDFDKEYMSQMVADHEKDVKEFENASKNAKDADLKAWAAKTLPTLQDHLKMAKDTAAKTK